MSGPTGLDVRLPIGLLFTGLGLLLGGFGLSSGAAVGRVAVPLNLNLWWGLVMLVFGALLLAIGVRASRRAAARFAAESPEGKAIEAREHELGLEQ